MEIAGWGRYPRTDSQIVTPGSDEAIIRQLSSTSHSSLIARGLGRSYGDSSLSTTVISTSRLDHLLKFDDLTGDLTCSAGVSLAEILAVFVPRGWFLPVTPGTKFVTVGGAIASDVHGKNHHLEGSFSDHVSSIKIATRASGIIECSRKLDSELFHASCGGMGLTGIILEATFRLKRINSSYIEERVIKTTSLEETLILLEENHDSPYSVAWIDCLATGKSLGRSLLMLGRHSEQGDMTVGRSSKLFVPADMPGFLLNRQSIAAFNFLYYNQVRKRLTDRLTHYEAFFYPLDGIRDWNRIYGKNGFIQYQLVLPKPGGTEGVTAIMNLISQSGLGSFLSVLKTFGKGNANHLSFPAEGYTLALDFKLVNGVFELLDTLDRLVLLHGGKLYLAKDARMSERTFKKSYPRWTEFAGIREKYGADKIFHSLQSQRLGI